MVRPTRLPNRKTGALARRLRHRGAALVEMAVILPVFVLIVLATIEATSMIFLRQTLEIAAYEGARVALVPGSDAGNVVAGCNQILDARGVAGTTITVSPSDFDSQPYGTPIRVEVTADCSANSVVSPWFYVGRSTTADVTMMKE